MLRQRIEVLQAGGVISPGIADRLLGENQAHAESRANKIWFCFFPPERGGQRGIERFFRSWGGEALYNLHEGDEETGPILAGIGVPCLVEAYVPIASLEHHSFLDVKVARQFLINRGLQTIEPTDHEDRAKKPISSSYILRIIRYPDKDFLDLTGCANWCPPL